MAMTTTTAASTMRTETGALPDPDPDRDQAPRPKGRSFTAEYEARVLAEHDALALNGPERGALVCREGPVGTSPSGATLQHGDSRGLPAEDRVLEALAARAGPRSGERTARHASAGAGPHEASDLRQRGVGGTSWRSEGGASERQ